MATTSNKQAQTLVPATIKLDISRQEINLIDVQLSLKYTNNSGYDECMTNQGRKGYVLKRGSSITQDGDVTITLIKTPDGKQDKDITALQNALKQVLTKANPKDYTKDITVSISNSSSDDFLYIRFTGYVSELTVQSPEVTEFLQYVANIQVYDPSTIKLEAR